MRAFRLAPLLCLTFLPQVATAAEAWPSRPIRVIVPFAPGGSSDIAARVFSQKLAERFGQPLVVDNRNSAGGVLGAELVARAPADGHTLGLGNVSSQTASPLIFPNVTYRGVESFTHIGFVGVAPAVLVVHPSFPARTVADLVKLAKAQPGRIDYGSGGNGSLAHIVGEMFKLRTGAPLVHVPYRGAAMMFTDLRANAIPVAFDVYVQVAEHVKEGVIRPLGIASAKRAAFAPDIPTFVESGYPDLVGENWLGFVGPAGVPAIVVDRIHREVMRVAQEPDVADRLLRLGITHQPMSPAQFRDYAVKLEATWGPVIRAAKIVAN